MHSRLLVRAPSGEILGIFSPPLTDHAESIRALIAAHPGAEVKSEVWPENPCPLHAAFEVDYCPTCGTAREIGR